MLQLQNVLDREIKNLSGGELQRFAIAVTVVQNADVFMFDEPSSYLDVKQRLVAARVIRQLRRESKSVCTFGCVQGILTLRLATLSAWSTISASLTTSQTLYAVSMACLVLMVS